MGTHLGRLSLITNSEETVDPLVGSAIAGRFHVQSLVHEDEFSRLYVGMDITEKNRIGVRIAVKRRDHTKMLDWLARAMLTTGKHAILAIGHLERADIMYVVLSEAALDIMRPSQVAHPEPLTIELEGR